MFIQKHAGGYSACQSTLLELADRGKKSNWDAESGRYYRKRSYEICTKNGNFHAKTCILATGGKSAKYTGSDGSGFLYLGPLSHHVIDLVPALTGLQAKPPFPKKLAGIRAEAEVKLFVENAQIASDFGEVQMTAEGISGIPVFQVSRFAAKLYLQRKKVRAEVDFFPRI